VIVVGGKNLDGIWFQTWSILSRQEVVYMIVYIHVPKRTKLEPSRKKGNFMGYKVSHMDIDCEEKKAPMDDPTVASSLVIHPSNY
jgi:hypothetical protein